MGYPRGTLDIMKIFITSYTYIYDHAYKVFDFFKDKSNLVFVIPKKWKSTKGKKKIVYAQTRPGFNIFTARTFFFHSKYPVVRGLLKGWMPGLGKILRGQSQPGDVFFSAYEPNLLVTYLYARLACRLGLKHIFFTWQNVPYQNRLKGLKLKITEWLLRENFRLSYGGLFGMRRAYEIHEPYFKFNPNLKMAVIPQTGIDIAVFNPSARETTDFRKRHALEDKFVFLFAATFTERKGVIPTIKAFAGIAPKFAKAHLVLVGMGNLETEIKKAISELKLEYKCTVLPWQPVDQLAPMYAAADVFVHPSEPFAGWEEQFGLLILQAQACGTPVIATRSGSLEESVLDGKTGLLAEPGRIEAIGAAMEKLISNESYRKELGINASQYITEHFSNQSVAQRLENYLISL
mgnify:FL=1